MTALFNYTDFYLPCPTRFGVSITFTILRGICLLPLPWFVNVLFYTICVLTSRMFRCLDCPSVVVFTIHLCFRTLLKLLNP
jgi:hypothetical protein